MSTNVSDFDAGAAVSASESSLSVSFNMKKESIQLHFEKNNLFSDLKSYYTPDNNKIVKKNIAKKAEVT